MNLQPLIERYITYRQALGESFKTNAVSSAPSAAPSGSAPTLLPLGPGKSEAFLDGKGPITSAWYGTAQRLARLLPLRHQPRLRHQRPPAAVLPQRPPPFVPYIYSQDELRRLLRGDGLLPAQAELAWSPSRFAPILLLLRRRLRLREAVALDRADVDLENLSADGAPDQVLQDPAGPLRARQLGDALAGYTGRRPLPWSRSSAPFFTMRTGAR